jgi:RHS repeat-associated protein
VTSSPAGLNCGSTCTYSFATNSTVTLTAVPAADSLFQGWSGCTSVSGATCTVSMTAGKLVYSAFVPAQYPLAVTKSGAGAGTVSSNPAGIDCGATCSANFANGANVTLTATPSAGATFDHWAGSCAGTAATCTLTLNAARAAEAVFAAPTTTTYQYDANGNLTQITDPLGNVRQTTYDALDRPTLVKEPSATTVGITQGQIGTAYDGQGQVARVTDPRNLATTYTVDGLGNLQSQTSPDTGTTGYIYDEAGNLKTRTDARGKVANYSYDALNRISQIAYGDQTVTYGWDACPNGLGRLCGVTDGSGGTAYGYDSQGRVLKKIQVIGTVGLVTAYAYTAGQLTGLTTPSGQTIAYDWANGRISAIRVNGVILLSGIEYEPFGPVMGWTWSNGQTVIRDHDLAGRARSISLGTDPKTGAADRRDVGFDAAGRIRSVLSATDASLNLLHGYDGLDRLVSTQRGNPALGSLNLAYDLTGNRQTKTLNGAVTTYTTQATSNRLMGLSGAEAKSFGYDNAGNQITSGTITHGYDNAGRRTSATVNGQTWSYAYNALGQRVRKSGSSTTLYAYDEQGRLLGEYDATGKLIQETVWLDDLPVLTLRPSGTATAVAYYVHADHLGTPRRITRPSDNKVMWQWESEPFGYSLPNENPQGLGVFAYNLRFPGQVYDAETGLHYNYFRDYDPGAGRYVQSDPIGTVLYKDMAAKSLAAARGLVSPELASQLYRTQPEFNHPYGYVGSNPLSSVDPLGLSKFDKLYGLPKEFWNWYHRKVKRPGDPDLEKEEAKELCEQWKKEGRPKPDNKQRGSADQDLLDWLLPWWLFSGDAY